MGGTQVAWGSAKGLAPCSTLFYLDLKVSMNKENIVLGWESVLASRAIRIPILGTIFFGFPPLSSSPRHISNSKIVTLFKILSVVYILKKKKIPETLFSTRYVKNKCIMSPMEYFAICMNEITKSYILKNVHF